jgi:hypothetical protein
MRRYRDADSRCVPFAASVDRRTENSPSERRSRATLVAVANEHGLEGAELALKGLGDDDGVATEPNVAGEGGSQAAIGCGVEQGFASVKSASTA